jgi:hypothetical protein
MDKLQSADGVILEEGMQIWIPITTLGFHTPHELVMDYTDWPLSLYHGKIFISKRKCREYCYEINLHQLSQLQKWLELQKKQLDESTSDSV